MTFVSDPGPTVRCRVAACRESPGEVWCFFLINDGDEPLDSAVLETVGYEWGDWGNEETVDFEVAGLAPGRHALVWRDDGSGVETRMTLSLRVRRRDREVRLEFEFPKLYRLKNLPLVNGLDKHGFEVAAEGRGRK